MINDNGLKKDKFSIKGFIVWGVCVVFFLYEFLLRTVIGAYQNAIIADLQLNMFQFSILSTVCLMIYGLMQMPAGMIVDRVGLKTSLLFGTALCALSSVLFSLVSCFYVALLCRVLMGLGASFGFVGLIVAIRDWMPKRHNGFFVGLSQFIGTLGPVAAAGPLDSFIKVSHISWRMVFLNLGLIGGLLFIAVLLFVDNKKIKLKNKSLKEILDLRSSLNRLSQVQQVWPIAIFSACVYFSLEYFSENSGRSFLMLRGFDMNGASYIISYAWLGFAIGAPILGFLSDLFENRVGVMRCSAVLSFLSMLLIVTSPDKLDLQISFCLLGFSAGAQSVGFIESIERCGPKAIALGAGVNNAMISVVSMINALLIGALLNSSSIGVLSIEHYLYAFNILLATSATGLLIAIFLIKSTAKKSLEGYVA